MLYLMVFILTLSTIYFYFRSSCYEIRIDSVIEMQVMLQRIKPKDAEIIKAKLKRHPIKWWWTR